LAAGGEFYFVGTDHIGHPVFATNDLGLKVWEASYLPFGGVHVSTGAINLRFPGQWFQSESGLHQNWMRDYDPTTGRNIQADPLGLVDGASVYGYARQNPLLYTDPTGQCPICVAVLWGAVYGSGTSVGLGWLLDLAVGDGCYTWEELGHDALLGALFGGAFAGVGAVAQKGLGPALAALWADEAGSVALSLGKRHGHHPIPQFLGGLAAQATTKLPQALHTGVGGFHQMLHQGLKNAGFPLSGLGSKGNSYLDWAKYFSANPGSQSKAFDVLVSTSAKFDATHGTSLAQDVIQMIVGGAFKAYP
jgi:RHS repeat-associated protein